METTEDYLEVINDKIEKERKCGRGSVTLQGKGFTKWNTNAYTVGTVERCVRLQIEESGLGFSCNEYSITVWLDD